MTPRYVNYRTGDGKEFVALVLREKDPETLNLFVVFDEVPGTPQFQVIVNAKPFTGEQNASGEFTPDHGWFE